MKTFKHSVNLFHFIGMVVTLSFEIRAFKVPNLGALPFIIALSLFILSPYALMIWATTSLKLGRRSLMLLMGTSVTITISVLYSYNSDVLRSSSTAAIVFLFMPFLQNALVAPTILTAYALRKWGE